MNPKGKKRDVTKALILERMKALEISMNDMASKLEISRQTFSVMMNHKHTDEWDLGTIIQSCKCLGITADELRNSIKFQ